MGIHTMECIITECQGHIRSQLSFSPLKKKILFTLPGYLTERDVLCFINKGVFGD